MKTGAIILAANASSLNKDYMNKEYLGSLTMEERVILNFQRGGVDEIVMVTGYEAKNVEKRLQHYGITFLRNHAYETAEMLDSVKMGLEYLQNRCEKILICPAKVSFFVEDTVGKILNTDAPLVLPVFNGRAGHPVCIRSELIPGILQYCGDGGLKGALQSMQIVPLHLDTNDEGTRKEQYLDDSMERLAKRHNETLMRPMITVQLAKKKPFLGGETMNLLKLIGHTESVKEACLKAGISYSKGWNVIHDAEEELGYSIVERKQGGKSGGEARLTEKALKLMDLFETYEKEVLKVSEQLYEKMLKNSELL